MGILGLDSDRTPIAQAKHDEITCYPVSSTAEAIGNIGQVTADPKITQVDDVLFSNSKGTVMTRRLADSQEVDAPINRSSNAHDSWFYLYMKKVVSDKKFPTTELDLLARVPFPVRSWALLGRSPCFRIFRDAFQPLHTLVAR